MSPQEQSDNTEETRRFLAERPRLLGIAYRMLGSRSQAEDIVQEAFLRWLGASGDGAGVENDSAFLASVVTRLCIDQYRADRVRRQSYQGPWLPEPLPTGESDPSGETESMQLLSMGLLRVMEKLGPVERAVFVLAEAFDYRAREIGELIGREEADCRQLLHRARQRVNRERERDPLSQAGDHHCLADFLQAAADGDEQALLRALSPEVMLYSDGGGKVPAASRPVQGTRAVSRLLLGLIRSGAAEEIQVTLEEVNAVPALFLWRDEVLESVLALELDDSGIFGFYWVRNPEKLRIL